MPSPRWSAAQRALVWAIRSPFPLEGAPGVPALGADVDWPEVARQARKHALEPLFHAAVAKLPVRKAIPAEVIETLRTAYQRTSRANLASYAELGRLLGDFERERIPVILLKGGALAAFSPAVGLRPMRDLDILVPRADVPRASAPGEGPESENARTTGNAHCSVSAHAHVAQFKWAWPRFCSGVFAPSPDAPPLPARSARGGPSALPQP
jgi:hypothetical protein